MGWINLFNIIIVILLLIPNIIYAFKNRAVKSNSQTHRMNIVEQIGRYGSMFFMAFNIGVSKFGFRSSEAYVIWLFCNGILLLLYWLFWVFYFKKPTMLYSLILAIIPGIIFPLNGFLLGHWLLVLFGMIFCVAHIYVVYQNQIAK